jgi:hypothetical protein
MSDFESSYTATRSSGDNFLAPKADRNLKEQYPSPSTRFIDSHEHIKRSTDKSPRDEYSFKKDLPDRLHTGRILAERPNPPQQAPGRSQTPAGGLDLDDRMKQMDAKINKYKQENNHFERLPPADSTSSATRVTTAISHQKHTATAAWPFADHSVPKDQSST